MALSPQIRSLWAGARLCGPAFTVQGAGGDNLALHHAVLQAPSGSVLVADAGGARFGHWGESSAVAASTAGSRACSSTAASGTGGDRGARLPGLLRATTAILGTPGLPRILGARPGRRRRGRQPGDLVVGVRRRRCGASRVRHRADPRPRRRARGPRGRGAEAASGRPQHPRPVRTTSKLPAVTTPDDGQSDLRRRRQGGSPTVQGADVISSPPGNPGGHQRRGR